MTPSTTSYYYPNIWDDPVIWVLLGSVVLGFIVIGFLMTRKYPMAEIDVEQWYEEIVDEIIGHIYSAEQSGGERQNYHMTKVYLKMAEYGISNTVIVHRIHKTDPLLAIKLQNEGF